MKSQFKKALLKLKSNILSKAIADQQDKFYRRMNDVMQIVRTRQANYIFGTEDEEHQTRQAIIRAMHKLIQNQNKSIENIDELNKAKLPIGTIHQYNGKPYKKEAEGKWLPVKETNTHPKEKEEPNKSKEKTQIKVRINLPKADKLSVEETIEKIGGMKARTSFMKIANGSPLEDFDSKQLHDIGKVLSDMDNDDAKNAAKDIWEYIKSH